MKKIISTIFGMTLAMMILLTSGFASTKAYAASDSAKYLKGARFLTALHGQDENDNEIILALYEKNGTNIAYLNDGISHVCTSYTDKSVNVTNLGTVERVTIGDTLFFDFFMADDIPCLLCEDGNIYACEYLTAYEMNQLISYE